MLRTPALAASALIIPVFALSACGGSSGGDKGQITNIIKAVGNDPSTLCTSYAAPGVIQQAFGGSQSKCVQASKGNRDPSVKINSVTITGSTAIAKITNEAGPAKGNPSTVHFVKQGGSWKVTTG